MNDEFQPPEADVEPRKTMGEAMDWKRILAYIALALLLITVLAVGSIGFMAWRFAKNQETEFFDDHLTRKHVAAIVKDLDVVRADPFFKEVLAAQTLTDPALNAGTSLNRMLSWQIPDAGDDDRPVAGGLELPNEITDHLDDWGEEWAEHAADFDPATIDFTWMGELKAYRFWTLDVESPLGDALARDPHLDPFAFPTPELRAMTAWVKLRLLSAMKADDPTQALTEVRHLAHLCLTTPNLISEMVGIVYLNHLNLVAEKLKQPTVPAETVLAAKRAMWGEQAYLDFTVPDDLYAQVFPENLQQPGACAALDERMPFAAFTRETLGPFYETQQRRFDERVALLAKACPTTANRKNYEMKLVPMMLSGDLFAMASVDEGRGAMLGDGKQWETVKKFPPLRRVLGLILANLGKTNGLGPYEGAEPGIDVEDVE